MNQILMTDDNRKKAKKVKEKKPREPKAPGDITGVAKAFCWNNSFIWTSFIC